MPKLSEAAQQKARESLRQVWKNGAYNNVDFTGGKKFKHSDATKQLLSKKQSDWIRNNADKYAWKHQNSNKSHPCEVFKNALRQSNIDFQEEFKPLDDRHFLIDIAFPALKVGIEINGTQHYDRQGQLADYYQQRHDLIEAAGWKLYEIYYSHVYNSKKLQQIIDEIVQQHNLDAVDLTFAVALVPDTANDVAQQKLQQQQAYIAKWQQAIESVDITQHGCIVKLAALMQCSHTHVRRMLKKHFPDLIVFQRQQRRAT